MGLRNKMIPTVLITGTVISSTARANALANDENEFIRYSIIETNAIEQNTDIVVRVGEYENKPGKRIYVDANFETPADIPIRHDANGYYISEWDINMKLAKRIVYYLEKYGANTNLQVAHGKSEDLNAAGRIAKAKNPTVYFSVHHNYFKEDSSGYFVMTNMNQEKDKRYAQALSNALENNPGNIRKMEVREQDGYIGEMNQEPGKINLLMEAGFFSNKTELKKIMDFKQIDYMAKETAKVLINIVSQEK